MIAVTCHFAFAAQLLLPNLVNWPIQSDRRIRSQNSGRTARMAGGAPEMNSMPREIDELNISVAPSAAGRHALLILSDSALPLGSFAFSNGLESYLAHHRVRRSFSAFLTLSLASMASTTIPYVLSAFRSPQLLSLLDNDIDASTPCNVARRASIAQGRALLGVWEKSFRSTGGVNDEDEKILQAFSASLRSTRDGRQERQHPESLLNGHFAPIWGLVCRSQGLSIQDTAYVFLFNHAKAVLSAAVRASVIGPYQAQSTLASSWLQKEFKQGLERNWNVPVEEAGQVVPLLDLWVGRHELLYSRIFNS